MKGDRPDVVKYNSALTKVPEIDEELSKVEKKMNSPHAVIPPEIVEPPNKGHFHILSIIGRLSSSEVKAACMIVRDPIGYTPVLFSMIV